MRRPAGGQDGAELVRQIVGGHPQSTDTVSRLQASTAASLLRSHGPALTFRLPTDAAALDRLADIEAQLGRVASAEHELNILVAHYEKAEREAAKAGASRAAELAAWRAATLRRRPV